MKKLGNLSSGEPVLDRHHSFFHQSVTDVLPELFTKIKSDNRSFISEEIDLGRIIGESLCVATTANDEILYAMRTKRKGHTRFVKNRQPIPSSTAVVILTRDEQTGFYILITAYIGTQSEPELWDKNATEKSKLFWNDHALIFDGSDEIIPNTETEVCPW